MEEKRAGVVEKVHPDLLVPPHVVDKLIELLTGEWQPDSSQQEQLVAHLADCSYCRIVLIASLSAEQEDERAKNSPDSPLRDLLTRFIAIHHEIEAREYEHMGAYAETIVAEGSEEAGKRFPILAEHIKRCPGCKSTLEATLAFLNESEETG